MAFIDINVSDNITTLNIGMRGEKNAEGIHFDITEWIEEYGSGLAYIYIRRNGDEYAYFRSMTIKDGIAEWLFTGSDTEKEGNGRAQVLYEAGDVVKKSAWYRTVTEQSEGYATGEQPDPYEDYLAEARGLLSQMQDMLHAADVAKTQSKESAAESKAQAQEAEVAAGEAEKYADAAGSVFKQVGNVSFVVNEDTSVTAIFTKEE